LAQILVIEDDLDVRRLIEQFLGKRDGHALHMVASLEEVQQYLHTTMPDLILSDRTLRGYDRHGWEIVRLLKESDAMRAVPAIAMSGHNGTEYRQAALAAGCDEFLPKPLMIADLRRAVERHLTEKSQTTT
jgi:two-component system, cell cycle response regulator DivK